MVTICFLQIAAANIKSQLSRHHQWGAEVHEAVGSLGCVIDVNGTNNEGIHFSSLVLGPFM